MAGWTNFTQINLGRLGNLERKVMEWLHRRFLDRLLNRHGGIQQCPWCNQCAQAYDGWQFNSTWDTDVLTCGNCGGTSRYRFEVGMIALNPIGLNAPPVRDLAHDRHGWDHRYRPLKKGELILATDQIFDDTLAAWKSPRRETIASTAPDPSLTSHRMYRRVKDAERI